MKDISLIRNFSIIAHIDHGKSTLADRLLELTHTIEKRKMKEQVLDSMELERERGITIKMQPVRMKYSYRGKDYVFNLIDTPGHIDFSYEVSRAQKAVEGAILLVDATQGIQAQTLTTLQMARDVGLSIIPAVNKIDSPMAKVEETKSELARLLKCREDEVICVSGKTGEGVTDLLAAVIEHVPPPKNQEDDLFRSLVFDFQYSAHRGIEVYVRVFSGEIRKGTELVFKVAGRKFMALETGIFSPDTTPVESISAGEIGYIVTGIKEAGVASVGDTVSSVKDTKLPFPGYMQPKPVVWASLYPTNTPDSSSGDDFNLLKQALLRLRLSDAAFTFEEESSGALGRGFRCGFLGVLHLEIVTERLRREFKLDLTVTLPSITYKVFYKNAREEIIYSPAKFPEEHLFNKVSEPWVLVHLITPIEYLGAIMSMLYEHEANVTSTENFGDNRTELMIEMPLRELMRNFFDEVKSASSGYASISYELSGWRAHGYLGGRRTGHRFHPRDRPQAY